MTERPYVLLSCATSLDGYIDDATSQRLVLSNDADLERIDGVRAGCDAILVGAGTIRRDDPRLLVRSAARRAERVARGLAASPARVTVTGCGDLDPRARVFTTGATVRLIYCASSGVVKVRERLGDLATVVDAGEPVDLVSVLADLAARGIGRLLVEGGASMHTQFLASGLADELHLVIAPFFVGDGRAPRFVRDGSFPWHANHRAQIAEVRQIGDVALVRYALSDRCPG
ncbi:RibD family protein [Salinispora cortesiana]|uniref:RibD family protein n=1 Tax=Salinispora cortesiana TaxID=1305843 RepID=UPI0004054AB6|nr:RibD family protein [Salinispora cortesiana]